MRRSLFNTLVARSTIAPALHAATVTGTTVDLLLHGDAARSAMVVVNAGVVTDGTHTIQVQDSPNGTDWTAVADEFLQGTEPAITSANDDRVHEIGYTGQQRYLRVVSTVTGTPSTGGLYAVDVLLGWPRRMPPTRS
ncbi:hypothetical protein AVW11_04030 [Streptomyces amritsarensis]|uniref:F5/8 type C domain-containing protein n=1 Tax=Streptomyces amritsarensis TaxID=681158 RepID=A0ABX3GD58_9ACTN|nr:hypothetical protein [Streptomyces amritsarensis]OLZ72569.1 hypothetical protein AVW11_04030 [Streptomyces amritsarensis]